MGGADAGLIELPPHVFSRCQVGETVPDPGFGDCDVLLVGVRQPRRNRPGTDEAEEVVAVTVRVKRLPIRRN
jgi:hypothetical protein